MRDMLPRLESGIMAVQSIERAFTLLRTIAQYPDGVSVTELARHTDLHKSTVSRLVLALEAENAVERLPANGGVCINNALPSLLAPATYPNNLIPIVQPYLQQLSDTTGETSGLCVPEENAAYYIDQVSVNRTVQIRDWTGERLPLHSASSGKVFLAYSTPEKVERYVQRNSLVASAKNTIVDRAELHERLIEIRRQGYDLATEEYSDGLAVIAAPIMNRENEPVASIFVCGPAFRFPQEGKKRELIQLVVDTCNAIERLPTIQKARLITSPIISPPVSRVSS